MYTRNEKVVPIPIEREMKDSYISYAMSVIAGRALPDARDGLKPVHRRILYSMQELGLEHTKPYKKAARIVGDCFVKDTSVLTTHGLIPIQEVRRGDAVYTENGIRRVTELYEMPPKPLLSVRLENGTRNVATRSQKFRVLTPELTFAWKTADALGPTDYVVIRAAYPTLKTPVALRPIQPTDPDCLDEDLAYLLGFWLSDGWIEKARGRVGFYSITKPIIVRIAHILAQRFGLHVPLEEKPYLVQAVEGPRRGVGYQVRVSRDAFAQYLAANFGIAGCDAWTKEIPQALFRSPQAVVWAFVSGLIDGDGSVHGRRNVIHYGSTSETLVAQLALLLQHQGVFSRRLTQQARPHRVNGRWVVSRRPLHILEIRGSNALLLAQRLHLANPKKRARLARIARARLKKSSHDVVPYAGRHIFKELSAHHLGSGWYRGADGQKFRQGVCYETGAKIRYAADLCETPLRKSQIAEWGIAEKLQRLGAPLAEFVDQIERDDLYFLRVAAVEPVPPEPTYDIQVEGEHRFIANGMVVHNCLGKYHPHGDMAVYDALVRMVQDFSLRYPLVDGQGNFGSVDGDSPASMRYTEARLAAIADAMLEDLDKDTVDFAPNFDESLTEPRLLPAAIPNLLVNGSSGIAVGMATNIPPHNLREVAAAVAAVIDDPAIGVKELAKLVKGPDFPTGGAICGRAGLLEAYQTGRGSLKVRAIASIEEQKSGKQSIIVTEIPYQVNKATLLETIAGLVSDKKLEGISDLRDESDKDGMRIVIELKRDANGQVVLNQLYKHTQLETSFGIIMLALVDNRPRVLTLKQLLEVFVEHRKTIVVRRTKFELKRAQERAHLLEGLKIALAHLDAIIRLIRRSKSDQEAKQALMAGYDLSAVQAQAILDMQLKRLTALEREKLEQEYLELIKKIELCKAVLASEKRVLALVREETMAMAERFGDERRTQLLAEAEELEIEDLIAEEDVVITISHAGYIKRLPVSAYRKQHRGGKGVAGAEMREEDFIEDLFVASTHDFILVFTDKGRVHWLRVYDVPQAGRQAKGKAIINLLQLQQGESMAACIPVREFKEDQFLVMVTKNGLVKKTRLSEYSHPRRAGIVGMGLAPEDALIEVIVTDGHQELLLATRQGKAIRFPEAQVREVGRGARGVTGMRFDKKDFIVGVALARKDTTVLTVTEQGFGKRTPVADYRVQARGGKGIINIKVTSKNGAAVALKDVTDQDELMIIAQHGQIVRCPVKDIRSTGRAAQGVRIIRLGSNDKVASVAHVIPDEGEGADAPAPPASP